MSADSLPGLFSRSLSSASKSLRLPTVEDETQDLIQSSLQDLLTLQSRIIGHSIFSPNEVLEDISTKDLIYLLVPFVLAEVQERVRTREPEERLESLTASQRYLKSFLALLDNYGIVPEDEVELYEKKSSSVNNPAARRELKIKQYQREKDLRARIETVRKRQNQKPLQSEPLNNLDLIASLLPSSQPPATSGSEDDSQTDDILRETILLLLRLCHAQAHSQLQSMDQELELLRMAPTRVAPLPKPSADSQEGLRDKQREQESNMWKLDTPSTGQGMGGQGSLIDDSGKPLRPFTILPAGATDRARLQAQVFRPDHNLPTMTIDEYLEIERQRGRFISGGGPASEAAPTTSEQLALDSEMDGTLAGEEKAETKRQKDEKWAVFTDANPKGAGNTMNRG
ncbi:Type 2A phosphatase-associated protein 42 [Paramarasmius palmivorus]|uniref:Type 2A phosphatase-associated protein 42 n=1 Tax=Paramarasmius palmivorus TaxID=297713 RepID=A0AAW0C3Z3_9AGAR